MIPFQERKKIRKILYSKISLALLFIVLFFVARGAWRIHQKAQIARSERDIAARSLLELQSRTAELKLSLEHLKSEQGVEEEVRQKYTVARPGEEVVIVVDETDKKSENGEALQTKSLWARMLSFFGF
ncbi:MAG: septum formation initiator family protein [bacterium]|nr:septum formation initiator family protein [bacterium]